ncbi:cell surface protein [Vagococcus lutrae]|uniref:CD1107 family mobile element protein n=1 Tax=Vagococcus lutrae TaxID=81947 RepID=UPI001925B37B|nr:DUF4366 domain-containing protein [Vagococcus lutrae]GEQ61683.1 cell surface protein [Vagococcus lutrae]GEQ63188.1 cell surface protein [Vagococcus lutrae]GEQ65080.1 cell surface protein [Vagococcus lutrae]
MKTFLKNKKVITGFLALVLLLSSVVGVLGFDKVIAYAIGFENVENEELITSKVDGENQVNDEETIAIGTQTDNPKTEDKTTQRNVEVLIKYMFEDGTVYKEYKVDADVGSALDSGDLPILPEDMKFVDNFLFYEVKKSDNVIERKVAKLTGESEKEEASTQTEITQEDIKKLEEKSKKLSKEIEKLKEDLSKSKEVSMDQKEKIEALEKEKAELNNRLEESKKLSEEANKKEESDKNKAYLEQVKALEEKFVDIDKSLHETNKLIKENKTSSIPADQTQAKEIFKPVETQQTNSVIPNISSEKNENKKVPKTVVEKNEKSKKDLVDNAINQTKNPNSNTGSTPVTTAQDKEVEIRYPNKLTPKQPEDSTSNDMNGNIQPVNSNKGKASDPSKSRASVTENVDNANNEFPVHHGTVEETKEVYENIPYYSADARQFVTFTTKNGKTFHLIINHDKDSENVMLLTEVSEDDLLNMVEVKEEKEKAGPVKIEDTESVKEERAKEEPLKQEDSSNLGTYLLVGIVLIGVLGAGYYFKVIKVKENNELTGFEEDDDYYYSEEEDSYVDSKNEDIEEKEEDIDSQDLL